MKNLIEKLEVTDPGIENCCTLLIDVQDDRFRTFILGKTDTFIKLLAKVFLEISHFNMIRPDRLFEMVSDAEDCSVSRLAGPTPSPYIGAAVYEDEGRINIKGDLPDLVILLSALIDSSCSNLALTRDQMIKQLKNADPA